MPEELKTLLRQFKNCLKYNDFDEYAGTFAETTVSPAPVPSAAPEPKTPLPRTAFAAPAVKPAPVAQAGSFAKPADNAPLPKPAVKKPEAKKRDLSMLDMAGLEKMVSTCVHCPLGKHRIKAVFGVGNPKAEIMLIGEGPGYEEDRQGIPFVGKAGQLLDQILAAMGLDRTKVYIANIVKCHPMIDPADPEKRGNDRPPMPEECAACRPYLDRQVEIIKPKFIIALGASAARELLNKPTASLGSLREKMHDYPVNPAIKLVATYHPAALLRDAKYKRPTWDDMKMVMAAAGITPPAPKGS